MLRIATLTLAALAVVCEAFAYWGLSSAEGRRTFDEMAGMIPFAAAVAGGLFAMGALVTGYLDLRAKRS